MFRNNEEAVRAIIKCSCYGTEPEWVYTKENMDKVLEEAESYTPFKAISDPHVAYWLGVAWRNYTGWHIRGDVRKPFLEKSICYFNKALDLSKELSDKINVAKELGPMLADERLVRDFDAAERVLGFIWENTLYYEPSLCSYVHLFYQKKEYLKSIGLCLELYERTKRSPEYRDRVPLFPLGYAAMSYRALGRIAKKEGKFKIAYEWYSKIQKPFSTDNDLKIIARLKSLQEPNIG